MDTSETKLMMDISAAKMDDHFLLYVNATDTKYVQGGMELAN